MVLNQSKPECRASQNIGLAMAQGYGPRAMLGRAMQGLLGFPCNPGCPISNAIPSSIASSIFIMIAARKACSLETDIHTGG